MATTPPSEVRAALTVVTASAVAEVQQVAQKAAESPATTRAALFAAVPLIVGDYFDGSSALALDWFEEIREDASPPHLFTPTPAALLDDDSLSTMVAVTTRPLFDVEQRIRDDVESAFKESLAAIEAEVQKSVATGFWDTIVENSEDDPDAVGWQRFARPAACKFCLMLADKGAVYTETTANFAAHTNCHCVAGPSYDPDAPRASVMQYVASARRRTDAQRAALREYLNQNFPDAPG